MEAGRTMIISPLVSAIANTAAIIHDHLSLAEKEGIRPTFSVSSPPQRKITSGSANDLEADDFALGSKRVSLSGPRPFVVLDETFREAVVDTSISHENRIGAATLPLMHAATHVITEAFEKCAAPKLTDWNSTGGAYFLNDASGRSIAVIKPEDEEPYAINNPKNMGSIPDAKAPAPSTPKPVVNELPRYNRKKSKRKPPTPPIKADRTTSNSTSGPKAVHQYIRRGIFPGEGAAREVAAFLVDHDHQAGVPPTALVLARHNALHVSEQYLALVKQAHEQRVGAVKGEGKAEDATTMVSTAQTTATTTTKRRNSSVASGGLELPVITAGGIPTLVQYALPPVKTGSLQLYVPHVCSAEDVGSSVWPVDEVHKIAILDIRLGNTDRNDDNMLVRAFFDGDPELAAFHAAEAEARAKSEEEARLLQLEMDLAEAAIGDSNDADAADEFDEGLDEEDEDELSDETAYELEEAMLATQHRKHVVKKRGNYGPQKGFNRGSKQTKGTANNVAQKHDTSSPLGSPRLGGDGLGHPSIPQPTLLHYWKRRLETTELKSQIDACAETPQGCCIVQAVLDEADAIAKRFAKAGEVSDASEGSSLPSPGAIRSSVPRDAIADTLKYPMLADAMANSLAQEAEELSDTASLYSTSALGTPLLGPMSDAASKLFSMTGSMDAATTAAVTSSLVATMSALRHPEKMPSSVGHSVQISALRGAMTPMLTSVTHHAASRRLHGASIDSSESGESGVYQHFFLASSKPGETGEIEAHPSLAAALADTARTLQKEKTRTSSAPDQQEALGRTSLSCSTSAAPPSSWTLREEDAEYSSIEEAADLSPSKTRASPPSAVSRAMSSRSLLGSPGNLTPHSGSTLLGTMVRDREQRLAAGGASPSFKSGSVSPNVEPLPAVEKSTSTPTAKDGDQPMDASAPAPAPTFRPWRSSRLEALRAKERETVVAPPSAEESKLSDEKIPQATVKPSPLLSGVPMAGVAFAAYQSVSGDSDAPCSTSPTVRATTVPVPTASPASITASPSSLLSTAGRACDVDGGSKIPDIRSLKTAKKLELVPIDHGLCLPHVNALDDISCSWVNWKQAKEPLSEARRQYVLGLDGRADTLLLYATLGERIRPPCLLTLRLCTALLQEGVRAGLTLAEIGLMMSRGSGVGVLARAEPADGTEDSPELSALEQAYRKAKLLLKRERRVKSRKQAQELTALPAGASASTALVKSPMNAGKPGPQQRKMPWNVPSKGPKKKAHRRAAHATASTHSSSAPDPDSSADKADDNANPLSFLAFHDAIESHFRVSLGHHIKAVLARRPVK